MESVDEDMTAVMLELSEFSKAYRSSINTCSELKAQLKITTEMLKASQESQGKMQCKLQKSQENLTEMQNILNGYINIKEENEVLKIEFKKVKDLLELEKNNFSIEKDKWILEKEKLMKTYSEEIQNLKKLRNMEVNSLNREIANIHEEYDRKIEVMKNAIENDYKTQLSRSVIQYEERMAKMSRDLISAQSELKNLRLATEDNLNTYNVEDKKAIRNRYIPQPLSYARYRPLTPIVSAASQMCKTPEEPEIEKSPNIEVKINNETSGKKKRKLYTRTDDLL